jgi:hypothetical protein
LWKLLDVEDNKVEYLGIELALDNNILDFCNELLWDEIRAVVIEFCFGIMNYNENIFLTIVEISTK